MDSDFLGHAILTGSPRATADWAEARGITQIRAVADFLQLQRGSHAVLDIDSFPEVQAIEVGRRFRTQGVGLTVATRAIGDLPFALQQNLATFASADGAVRPLVPVPRPV